MQQIPTLPRAQVIETAPEDRSKNDSDALTVRSLMPAVSFLNEHTLTTLPIQPAPASLVTSNLLMQDPDVFSTASSSEPDPQMEEALSYRASLLFNVRDDPRFLRFLPVVFPPPPSFEHGLRGGESTLGSSFYMLATLYPAYLERGELVCSVILALPHILTFSATIDIWYHIGFDVEGVLPFVPYITGDNYNPHDLSRRLSSDIPDVRFLAVEYVRPCAHHTHRWAATQDTPAFLPSSHPFTASFSMMISSHTMSPEAPTIALGPLLGPMIH